MLEGKQERKEAREPSGMQFCQITQRSRINNYQPPFCKHKPDHKDYNVTEICISKTCPDNFRPLCIRCKYEQHLNEAEHAIQPIKFVLHTLSDELQKERDKVIIR